MKKKQPKLITRKRAAELLGVDPQTITNIVSRGILKPARNITTNNNPHKSLVYSEELFGLLNKMGDLIDIEGAQKEIKKFKEELYEEKARIRLEISKYRREVGNLEDVKNVARILNSKLYEVINAMMRQGFLYDREKAILISYFRGESFQEMEEKYDLSHERLRQIICKAINKCENHIDTLSRYEEEIQEKDKEILEKEREIIELKIKLNKYQEKFGELKDVGDIVLTEEEEITRTKLCIPIIDLNFSTRAINCMKSLEIETLGDLVSLCKSDLLRVRNTGKKTVEEITDTVYNLNLAFGMNTSKYGLK